MAIEPITSASDFEEALKQICENAQDNGVSKGAIVIHLRLESDEIFETIPESEQF